MSTSMSSIACQEEFFSTIFFRRVASSPQNEDGTLFGDFLVSATSLAGRRRNTLFHFPRIAGKSMAPWQQSFVFFFHRARTLTRTPVPKRTILETVPHACFSLTPFRLGPCGCTAKTNESVSEFRLRRTCARNTQRTHRKFIENRISSSIFFTLSENFREFQTCNLCRYCNVRNNCKLPS